MAVAAIGCAVVATAGVANSIRLAAAGIAAVAAACRAAAGGAAVAAAGGAGLATGRAALTAADTAVAAWNAAAITLKDESWLGRGVSFLPRRPPSCVLPFSPPLISWPFAALHA